MIVGIRTGEIAKIIIIFNLEITIG